MRVLFPAAVAIFTGLHSGSVVAVTGLPRYGKTVLLQQADLAGSFSRRVVYDPYNRRDRREATLGRPISPWDGHVVSLAELRRNPALLDQDPLALVVQPSSLDQDKLGAEFTQLAELLWATGNVDLLAEEAGLYSRFCVPLSLRLATGGGHVGMRLVLVSQSISRLHVDVRRYLTHVVTFAQTEPLDVKAIRERCGKDFAAAVQRQQKGSAPLVWAQGQTQAVGGEL